MSQMANSWVLVENRLRGWKSFEAAQSFGQYKACFGKFFHLNMDGLCEILLQ